ncbi:hypothetical protein A3844_26900 [Paenibacillus helianthi]|uniref:ADP-ribosylglycohydrolase family protein n=1 Tax=Paenibacillus helianthi TaxID=1349432 RepID=A0ABX3EFY4_9BACL|nr:MULTISPECIES: ADP-ribosylglycohydrolase family protein [Paenibacillus]OKP80714.1 hypothetical protein A3844_26900 [Paenibacillus helianthi]OKP89124.1 hypothetical protein A3848_16610 [Paenibacillus sp. P32E]
MEIYERIWGGLSSLACGDALGVLAVGYNPAELINTYGAVPRRLVTPIPSSPSRTKWNYGEVTDDTYQTIVIAENLVCYHRINKKELVKAFICLPDKYAKIESSTGRLKKDPNPYKRRFSVNSGAAMRISPLGIAFSIKNEVRLVSEVLKATQITHNSKSALAGAAAIAFAASALLDGCACDQVIEQSIKGAWLMRGYGDCDGLPAVYQEIETACNLGYEKYREKAGEGDLFGGLTVQAVPFALALASALWNAEAAICKAVEMGGDTDTIASITGLLCGICNPRSTPSHILKVISEKDTLHRLAVGLADIRC